MPMHAGLAATAELAEELDSAPMSIRGERKANFGQRQRLLNVRVWVQSMFRHGVPERLATQLSLIPLVVFSAGLTRSGSTGQFRSVG
jgi:hypothetical protein